MVYETRGGGDGGEIGKDGTLGSNAVFIYGCPPNSSTTDNSVAVGDTFKMMWYLSDKSERSVRLPGLMLGSKPGNVGETIGFVCKDIIVKIDAEKEQSFL